MALEIQNQNRDLLLSPDTYAYMQSEGKGGNITVYCGPGVVNQTGQDKPVVFDQEKLHYRFVDLSQAVQQCPRAGESDYVIIENPAKNNQFPTETVNQTTTLEKGKKIVVSGPWSQPLWPGQSAKVVKGHSLRSDQYLIVNVYNEIAARENWSKMIKKPVAVVTDPSKPEGNESQKPTEVKTPEITLTVGQKFIIKGTEVSFYIPATGFEVLPDENGSYVRGAITLEQLEYCVLVDENGKKRIPHGPQVVFPTPTEQFITDKGNNRKFRAYELNDIQGIHVKVIQDYKEGEKEYKQGDELFITGKETSIYFPREEHSVIEYGEGNTKHFATAIPAGEARYVMNRSTGQIDLMVGPKMLLPNPKNQIIIRRVLSDKQCELWYPGNEEALEYNRSLREVTAEKPSGRSGFVSEGDYRRAGLRGVKAFSSFDAPQIASSDLEAFAGADVSRRENVGTSFTPNKFTRGTSYTPPRQVTLNTKYDGVPSINIWTGYAVLVVGKTGNRRVEVGPQTLNLNYDESLEVLTLSTGKPKTTDSLMKTAYLRTTNNKISDIIEVETSDHVKATLKLSFCVSFEGDKDKWFSVENYVKFLCDHVRSILKGMVKKHDVENFYQNSLPIIRDAILGSKPEGGQRTGLVFQENGMRVVEVEVLDVTLDNPTIAKMLNDAQHKVVEQNISLHQARKAFEVEVERQKLNTATEEAAFEARRRKIEIQKVEAEEQLKFEISKLEGRLDSLAKEREITASKEEITSLTHTKTTERQLIDDDVKLKRSQAEADIKAFVLGNETKAAVERLAASKDGLAEALVALGRQDVMVKVAEAVKIDTFLSGDTMEGAIGRILAGFPILTQVMEKVKADPKNRLTSTVN